MAVRQGRRALTIAHLLPWPGIGGTEHATLRVARAAAEHGYRSIAFYREDSPVVGEFFRDAGLETAPYALAELSMRRPLPFVRNTLALRSAFRAHRVDLVHCADIDAALSGASGPWSVTYWATSGGGLRRTAIHAPSDPFPEAMTGSAPSRSGLC